MTKLDFDPLGSYQENNVQQEEGDDELVEAART